MKYYSLKYKHLRERLGSQHMWKIVIQPGHEHDTGILEHEKLHVRQWYATMAVVALIGALLAWCVHPAFLIVVAWSPWAFSVLMRSAWFRRTMELAGYKKQAEYGDITAARRMVETLVRMGVSRKRAEKALL